MSLQVWLPLNGNLQNKGLQGDISVTSTGATVSQEGKIGKCYYFNGSSQYLQLSKSLPNLYAGDFSLAIWLKPTDSSRGIIFSECASTGASNVSLELYTNRIIRVYWNSSPDWHTNIALEQDIWSHIAVTRHENTLKVYVNGELKATKNNVTLTNRTSSSYIRLGDDYRGGTSVSYAGYMNDARSYDHCLSLKEIKEISKGLILHYPLDNNGFGKINPNMISNSSFSKNLTGWRGYPTYHTIEIKDGYSCAHFHSDTLAQTRYLAPSAKNNLAPYNGYQLTFSADVLLQNVVKGTTNYFLALYGSGAKIDGVQRTPVLIENSGHFMSANSTALSPDKLNGKGWTRVWVKFRFGDYNWPTSYFLDIYERDFIGDFYVKNVKIEEGLELTPWIPNSTDEQYDILGYDQNIIYDTSGYQNDGITNNITYSLDTPKYKASSALNASTTSYIKASENKWMPQGAEQLTINFWTKATTWPTNGGRLVSCTQSGGFNIQGGNSGYWRFPVHVYTNVEKTTTRYKYDSKEIKISALKPNEWNMISLVYDTTGTKTYINGKLHHTYSNASYGIHFNTNAKLFLGCQANTARPTSPYFTGQMSDFRIYATALKNQDILQLYHTLALVDKNNNFYTYQYNEQEYSNELQYFYDWIKINGSGTFSHEKDGLHLNEYIRVRHDFISINPENKTFKYDITYSVDAGNQFYVGWERYDEDKTLRSNNATVYVITIKPNTDLKYQHAQGVVNLSTDGVNPCAFIRLRILNKWAGSTEDTNGTAIIHSLSLKEYDSNKTITPIKIERQGITTTNSFIENSIGTSIDRSQVLHSNSFYEI